MSLLSNGNKLILLHKGLNVIKGHNKYDLVLSPQFYILKREKLPVKYAFQAKKLAPSLLEDLLPSNYKYEYLVQKDGEYWNIFAYSPKEIEEFLRNNCRISANKIGKIYFADQLRDILKKLPVGIDEKTALALVNDKATVVPRSMISSEKYAKFTNKLRPKQGINFKVSSKSAGADEISKSAIVASVVMALLGGLFIFEGLNYKKALNEENNKISDLLVDYPSLQSKSIRDSIKAKYEKIEKRERAIREFINKSSKLSSKNSILSKLNLDKNKLIAEFKVEPSQMQRVINIAKSSKLNAKKVSSNILKIEEELK